MQIPQLFRCWYVIGFELCLKRSKTNAKGATVGTSINSFDFNELNID